MVLHPKFCLLNSGSIPILVFTHPRVVGDSSQMGSARWASGPRWHT